ncbi:hypothetical protein MNBD_ALPHA09-2364 [hydrothermal vent metagenome]|uniref:Plastocyanin-like domain-containing protein n=1 Tax=hydrothermal vent metagenome TaxID=652676 RepID=A0A3B0T4R7_9ZZZZ
MIRIFVLVGIVGGLAIAYLAVFAVGPTMQLPPSESLLTGFRAQGVVPASFDLAENEEVEHEIFGVPDEDEAQLEMAMKAMGGMNMGAMKMEGDTGAKMKLNPDGTMMTNPDGSMVMETAEEPPHGEEAAEEVPHGEGEARGGLKITSDGAVDREIELKMTEWGFSEMNIEVTKGERIRFNVVNDGEILHEFMIMQMVQMQAVSYRVNRADWSLLEHDALYEKSLLLPDGKVSFVLEIQEDGAWMFMCMLPYHMEMGMMGQMATPGMAMDMQM